MASIMLKVPVVPGLAEYLGTASLGQNETITLEFERSAILEDVAFVGSDSVAFELYLAFPSSEQQGLLASSNSASSWLLNGLTITGGKQWCRLPARTRLILKKTTSGSHTAQLMALVRKA